MAASLQKHLLNEPATLVLDSLKGLAYLNPRIELDQKNRVVSVKEIASDTVHLLCGGGSGHEPAHAAFVGTGMLSAAVCGNVFASPNSGQVTAALQKLASGKGTLIILKNYTGDVLHFGIAKEQWAAHHPGEEDKVRVVIVGDDVSVGKTQGGIVGRRGLAGTVLVYKISGALAAKGGSLDAVYELAQYVADRTATIGIGLEHCHVPGTDTASVGSGLKADELEIGMGIHNEPGYQTKKLASTATLVGEILTTLTSTSDTDRSFLPFSDKASPSSVVLLVNNLGGLSELELAAVAKEAGAWLADKGIVVKRALSGTLMTSLNMPGVSLSVILLPSANDKVDCGGVRVDEEFILELLDAATDAPGWKPGFVGRPNVHAVSMPTEKGDEGAVGHKMHEVGEPARGPPPGDPKLFLAAISRACQALIDAEPDITRYDTLAGDGDCGLTLKAGASGVLSKLKDGTIEGKDVVKDILVVSQVVEMDMGGTSGGLYSIFFNALAIGIRQTAGDAEEGVSAEHWAKALEHAQNTLLCYTRARPPSRTLVDPLISFITTLSLSPSEFSSALQAAKEAADATAYLQAKAGRAAYVDKEKVKGEAVPDAGAWGVWKVLEGIQSAKMAARAGN